MGRMTEADDAILRWWERVRLKFQDRADLLAERGWSRERISRFIRFDIEEAVPLARDLLDALIEPSSPALEAASDAGIDALLAMLEEGLIERAMSRSGRQARRDGRTLAPAPREDARRGCFRADAIPRADPPLGAAG